MRLLRLRLSPIGDANGDALTMEHRRETAGELNSARHRTIQCKPAEPFDTTSIERDADSRCQRGPEEPKHLGIVAGQLIAIDDQCASAEPAIDLPIDEGVELHAECRRPFAKPDERVAKRRRRGQQRRQNLMPNAVSQMPERIVGRIMDPFDAVAQGISGEIVAGESKEWTHDIR